MDINFEPTSENYGFDATARPNWLLVPLAGEKTVWLTGEAGITFTSTSPGIATVEAEAGSATPIKQKLIIKGKMAGRTFIEAHQGRQIKRLEVSVKPLITLSLSFHYVSDKKDRDGNNHSTNRVAGDLEEMIFLLNKIFVPQANVSFYKKKDFQLNMNKNLGDAVNYNVDYQKGGFRKGHEFDLVVSNRDPTANINIFFVWENEFEDRNAQGQIVKSGALGYSAGGRDILIQDWNGLMDRNGDGTWDTEHSPAWENARMLAHELGHILGIGDVVKTKNVRHPVTHDVTKIEVNADYVMGSGPFIPKDHANIMFAIAKQIAGR